MMGWIITAEEDNSKMRRSEEDGENKEQENNDNDFQAHELLRRYDATINQ